MNYKVKNIKLAAQGVKQLAWAAKEMPVLMKIRTAFAKTKPLAGLRIAACLHITKETGVLLLTLQAGGAAVSACASNPLSTQDSVAAALAKNSIYLFARMGQSEKEYYQSLNRALDIKPHLTLDDGADLVTLIHTKRKSLLKSVYGGAEETTTGVIRLRAMARAGKLRFPVVAVNDTPTKHLFDNYYGTGQSTIDGITRATNLLWAGKKVVVAGYGDCGSGIALRAKGMGAQVIVTETNPLRALKATMDGFYVTTMRQAVKFGEVFITATGGKDILRREHFLQMPDGAILANAGHFNVEINLKELSKLAQKVSQLDPDVEGYELKNGRKIFLLSQGRLVNLAAGEGHPSSVMDMSFANQALVAEWLAKNHQTLQPQVYSVPKILDEKIAQLKLESLGVKIDRLSPAQQKYLQSWQAGT